VPELRPLAVYLDSNVLFSASINEQSRFLDFWRLDGVEPVISPYVIGEVTRNLRVPGHATRLEKLLERTRYVSDADIRFVPAHIVLVDKDRPILATAIAASVDYLATGDKNHFGHLYDTTVSGVRIVSPSSFLAEHKDRLLP